MYYRESDWNFRTKGFSLNLPYHQLLRIDELKGFMGNQAILRIGAGAYEENRKSGRLDVLPYNSEYTLLWTFFSRIDFWGLRDSIANFWRFKGVAGIKEHDGEVLKLCAMTAAIPLLTVAGQAYRAGFSSESVSKDGVSVSKSYTSSATFSIYSAQIEDARKWSKEAIPKIRNRYRGIPMTVL